jgi:hypothetical protein
MNFKFVLFDKYNHNDQVKEKEMDMACSMNGEEEKRTYIIDGMTMI